MKIHLIWLAMVFTVTGSIQADEFGDHIRTARTMLKKGDAPAALKAAEKAVQAEPKNHLGYFIRGEVYGFMREPTEAIKDFDKSIELDKTFLIAVDRRGGEQFKLAKVDESIKDFNTFIKANPREEAAHWRRGISFYYAGKYDEGAKQFVDGQEAYGTDVENAFWHYLCVAKKSGVKKARTGILPIMAENGKFPDTRIPMKQVYDLIQGKAKPADVLETAAKAKLDAEDQNEAIFYAHLYVALNYEAEGDTAKAIETMQIAVKHKITHYMWDVANVHLKLTAKK